MDWAQQSPETHLLVPAGRDTFISHSACGGRGEDIAALRHAEHPAHRAVRWGCWSLEKAAAELRAKAWPTEQKAEEEMSQW